MKTAVVVEIHSEASKRVVIEREPDSKAVVIESFQGSPGKSTYELAVKNGFLGSEAQWLESLKPEEFDINEKLKLGKGLKLLNEEVSFDIKSLPRIN